MYLSFYSFSFHIFTFQRFLVFRFMFTSRLLFNGLPTINVCFTLSRSRSDLLQNCLLSLSILRLINCCTFCIFTSALSVGILYDLFLLITLRFIYLTFLHPDSSFECLQLYSLFFQMSQFFYGVLSLPQKLEVVLNYFLFTNKKTRLFSGRVNNFIVIFVGGNQEQ